MLGTIDKSLKPLTHNLFLCKPDKTTIAKLTDAYDITVLTQLGVVNEISFKIPSMVEKDRVPIVNPNIERIRHRYYFKLVRGKEIEYFIFNQQDKVFGEEEYIEYKGYSIGYELIDKSIRDLEIKTKNLRQMADEVLKYTNWKVGYVDSEFELKYRTHEISSQNVLQIIYDLAQKFNAVIKWDTVKREISFFLPQNIGSDKGLKMKYGKYLESFNLSTNSEETITRLKIFGQDELSIRRLTPTGSNYIEDFSWYMYPFEMDAYGNVLSSSHYMSDGLCKQLISYQELLKSVEGRFETLSKRLLNRQEIATQLERELNALEAELVVILDKIDVSNSNFTADTPEHRALVVQKDNKGAEIKLKKAEIDSNKTQLRQAEEEIEELRSQVNIENNLSSENVVELNQFIIEKEYHNDSIIDDEDLLAEGLVAFETYRAPKISLNIDIINFLEMVESQNDWDKLILGDTVRIYHERLQADIKAKIIEITYNLESQSISLVVANEQETDNIDEFMKKINDASNTSTIVDMDKYKWNLSKENNGSINDIINNKWDSLKNAIMAGYEQMIEISERGIIVRSLEDPLDWLVIQNGFLAITNDGGNTWKHAISSEGIFGERIFGKIIAGVNLIIEDESGIWITQGSRTTIYDRNKNEVMRLGLVSDNPTDDKGNILPSINECFGLSAWNSVTKVEITDCTGISISKKDGDDWKKVFWANPEGTLYTEGIVAKNIKITDNFDNLLLDAENNIFNAGLFDKIIADGKVTTIEKLQLVNELHKIHSDYKRVLEHAKKYEISKKDDVINFDGAWDQSNQQFPTNSSTTKRFDTTPLVQAYTELVNYCSAFLPIVDKGISENSFLVINDSDPLMEETSEIEDRAKFVQVFRDYHEESLRLKQAIEDSVFYSGIHLGEYYNNLMMNEYGFVAVRSDGKYRAYLNATNGLALQKWESGGWVSKLYATLGDPMWDDGTLYAEGLVTKNLRIVDAHMNEKITFDWYKGITIYGDNGGVIYLNANDAIRIQINGDDKFWVGMDGRLYAKDITTEGLRIVDAELGEKIIFDQEDGITINGNNGEQIRLNANEGIAIDVNEDKRIWIGTDGLMYAKKLIVVGDEDDENIFDEVDGSYISDLTVNKVRTLNSNAPQDHVYIKDNFIKLMTGTGARGDFEKFRLELVGTGLESYPVSTWGAGSDDGFNKGIISKPREGFYFDFTGTDGQKRRFAMQNQMNDSMILETPFVTRISAGQRLRLEVNASNFIEITPSGVVVKGSKISLN